MAYVVIESSNVYNNKVINQCQLRRAEQSLHFASIPTNFSIVIILRPRPRTFSEYASTSPLLLLQLHQQQQVLSINIINSTNHHLQHAKLRILLQHFTSHAAYERSGGPPPLYILILCPKQLISTIWVRQTMICPIVVCPTYESLPLFERCYSRTLSYYAPSSLARYVNVAGGCCCCCLL